ncbi:cupredoxin domain-containing protein [Candidatus Micrarchaeota archaeon]|nr:cupredoxin domain-containing protein [Candidatus Micrarchaeota archaeon]
MTDSSSQSQDDAACKDCPPQPPAAKSDNAMYFGVLAFLVLVGLTASYAFYLNGAQNTAPQPGLLPGVGGGTPDAQDAEIRLESFRYQPNVLQVQSGKPIHLTMTRVDEAGCANSVVFYSLGKSAPLPKGQPVAFDLPSMQKGQTLEYGCSMRMAVGKIVAV